MSGKFNEASFAELLARAGLAGRERGPWLSVGAAESVQGWKLHVASVPVQAYDLLVRVLPILRAAEVPFKFARTALVLGQLNEGSLGSTQVGKFMTIYPRSEEESLTLAHQLARATEEFSGPTVVTDKRLAQVVYTRYGNYNPVISRDRLGQISFAIYAPDGSLRTDSYQVPFVCPEGVTDIFADFPGVWRRPPDNPQACPSGKLFGPGYLVLETIRAQAKGSVYLALDLRSQDLVGPRVIKQGRRHCMSDFDGRDMRDRLQRQAYLHSVLEDVIRIPRADPYFEVEGDGYLPLTWIEGETIEKTAVDALASRPWSELAVDGKRRLLTLALQLVEQIQKLHAKGYVHRDLTAGNVWVSANDEIYLLDLELAHYIHDPSRAFALGTAGFMSPNQENRGAPVFEDDVFAIGAVLLLLLTGMDPRRIQYLPEGQRLRYLQELTHEPPCALLDVIVRAVAEDPAARPELSVFLDAIGSYLLSPLHSRRPPRRRTTLRASIPSVTQSGCRGLLFGTAQDSETGLWLSPAIQRGKSHAYGGQFELRRGTNRGVAGVLYLLGTLARTGFPCDEEVVKRSRRAAQWLVADSPTIDSGLPGLHFGEAGVAVALAESAAAGLTDRSSQLECFIEAALTGQPDWPDITHGAAGQGLAAFTCADRLQMPSLNSLAKPYADYLLSSQQPDGSWRMPAGVDGMSGQTLTGFAHGVAGMVYFLAIYADRTPDEKALHAALRGAAWLEAQALPAKSAGGLEWVYSDTQEARWTWWCHGAPGIALTFLKLLETTGDSRWRELAEGALLTIPENVRSQNLSQCHGLSGLGEICLEAHRVLGGNRWKHRAESIAATIVAARRQAQDHSVWLVEEPDAITADLMAGCSGIVHFLHRLGSTADVRFPLL